MPLAAEAVTAGLFPLRRRGVTIVIERERAAMNEDRDMFRVALSNAIAVYRKKTHRQTLLGQDPPDDEVLGPVIEAIESFQPFQKNAGNFIFTANAGFIVRAQTLAPILFFRAYAGSFDAAFDWFGRVLTTETSPLLLIAAIWGVRVETEITLSETTKLVPFSSLPKSRLTEYLDSQKRRVGKSIWLSRNWHSAPTAALVVRLSDFPYLGGDDDAFKRADAAFDQAQTHWRLIEAIAAEGPIAVAHWFEYVDHDLDLRLYENMVMWDLPEVAPRVLEPTVALSPDVSRYHEQYANHASDWRRTLRRSMERFVLSQCRLQPIDRVLDLALAFEIAVSGERSNAPISWKISHRTAQFIGGEIEARKGTRDLLSAFYTFRNRATHGSSLSDFDEVDRRIIEQTTILYRALLKKLLANDGPPDWKTIELLASR